MKTLQSTVKTIYNIELDMADFALILERFHKDKSLGRSVTVVYPLAFEWLEKTYADVSEGWAEAVVKNMQRNAHGDTYKLIAEYLGFDGYENSGYYNETKRIYRMSVYNNGDTLNK